MRYPIDGEIGDAMFFGPLFLILIYLIPFEIWITVLKFRNKEIVSNTKWIQSIIIFILTISPILYIIYQYYM